MKKKVQKSVCAALVAAALMGSVPTASALSYQQGDEAEEIKTIQTALTELDLYYVEITGHFGKRTAAAVKKFQKKVGLPQTGIVDNDTRELLYLRAGVTSSGSGSSSAATVTGGVTSSGTISTNLVLREGSRGDAVTALQEQLQSLQYFTGTVTGHYGRLTKEAVRLFQKDHDLDADGVAGRRTLTALAEIKTGASSGSTTTPTTPSTGTTTTPSTGTTTATTPSLSLLNVGTLNTERVLRRRSNSGYVTRLQNALNALGYFKETSTGYFGSVTEEAVIAYQKAKGLTADGIAGRATLTAINEDIAKGTVVLASGSID
ncbi:MAG: peptidoglycan-binding protein [Clostridia bacterium]|nr:peptidoglycan-binding protein [Clostridia bacterium]